MVLVRFGFPVNRTAGTLSTSQIDMFRVAHNSRVVLKKIRFNKQYTSTNEMSSFDLLPHMVSIDFGTWLRDNDETNMHNVGNTSVTAPAASDIEGASHSSLHVLLASSSCSFNINGGGNYEGVSSYDMDVDYDFGVIETVPRFINATMAMYRMNGAREDLVPAMEVVLDIQ